MPPNESAAAHRVCGADDGAKQARVQGAEGRAEAEGAAAPHDGTHGRAGEEGAGKSQGQDAVQVGKERVGVQSAAQRAAPVTGPASGALCELLVLGGVAALHSHPARTSSPRQT